MRHRGANSLKTAILQGLRYGFKKDFPGLLQETY